MDSPTGLKHQTTIFLSYRRKDADEVSRLQSQLHVRGVQAWRDVTHLPIGSVTKDEIIRTLTEECDVFLLYVTPECLDSDFIWRVEVPAALHCYEYDHSFGIIPVLRGVSINQLRQCCARHGVQDLTEFNATFPTGVDAKWDESVDVPPKEIAQRILQAVLHQRLHRVNTGHRTYEPSLCLHTFHYVPPIDNLDLDLNWSDFFKDGTNERWPSEQEWQDTLLPALYDVKNTLSTLPHSRILHIAVHAFLPVAFALGFVLPQNARFTLVLEHKLGKWRSDEPSLSESEPLTTRMFEMENGDRHVAVVELSISRWVTSIVDAQLPSLGITPSYRLQLEIKGGPGIDSVKDGAHASAIARQFGRELRVLYDRRGVRQIHLFFAAPVELATLLGHHLNATGTLHVYQHVRNSGFYVLGCVLQHQ
ncbi:MAG: hypothetical protein NVS2B2_29410 [Ktedonobacteraceae bacterium]